MNVERGNYNTFFEGPYDEGSAYKGKRVGMQAHRILHFCSNIQNKGGTKQNGR
jgi:hypothetical protein